MIEHTFDAGLGRDAAGRTMVLEGEMLPVEQSPPHPESGADAPPIAEPTFVRFRDRVRARTGAADLLTFRIGSERFGFDIRAVDEVLDDIVLQPVPEGPTALAGVMTFGGVAIPVFEPAHFLGITHDVGGTVLVMRSGERRIGLVVDDVDEVETVDLAAIAPPPFETGDDMLLGVLWRGEELTALVDARALVGACHLVTARGRA